MHILIILYTIKYWIFWVEKYHEKHIQWSRCEVLYTIILYISIIYILWFSYPKCNIGCIIILLN